MRLAGEFAPIIENATRLCDDAKRLRASRSYASATALAILSMEELGKLMLYHDAFDQVRSAASIAQAKSTRSHKRKQELAASLLIGNLLISEVEHLAGFARKDQLKELEKNQFNILNVAKFVGSIDKVAYQVMRPDRPKKFRHHGFLIDLAAGQFEKLKQECIYSDCDGHGRWINPAGKVNRETADKVIGLAHVALNSIRSNMSQYEW